jgi:hypothetical protein
MVERARRLVEEQDRRLLRERTRDDEALPLAAAEAAEQAVAEPARSSRSSTSRTIARSCAVSVAK